MDCVADDDIKHKQQAPTLMLVNTAVKEKTFLLFFHLIWQKLDSSTCSLGDGEHVMCCKSDLFVLPLVALMRFEVFFTAGLPWFGSFG